MFLQGTCLEASFCHMNSILKGSLGWKRCLTVSASSLYLVRWLQVSAVKL